MNRNDALRPLRTLALGLVVALAWATAGLAEDATSVADALKKGKPSINLRYRLETVSEDAFAKDATASTLRTVIGYTSADYKGFSVFGEAENVTVVGNELYNNRGAGSLANGITDRPVVADPALTEINQTGLRYQNEDWKVTLGRHEIILGDARYVGNVGWRQNHQSFDAVRIENQSLEQVTFSYSFVDQVNRIFGDSQDHSSHLINAIVDTGRLGKLTLYGYLLNYRDPGAAGASTATYGIELTGKQEMRNGLSWLYELEYAQQRDSADNPNQIDADYIFVVVGASIPLVTVKLGWEVLGGSPGDGSFRTPLATLHKWNGWADKFVATPATGLADLHLTLTGKAGALSWLARYHDFSADTGDADFGSEIDLQLLYKTPWEIALGLKAALYDADQLSTDTDKLFAWAGYSF